MIPRMLKSVLCLCLCSYAISVFAEKVPVSSAVSIDTAISRGWLKASFSGAYDPQFAFDVIDQNGIHYGKCMLGIFESLKDTVFNVELKAGRMLLASDSAVQNMVITHSAIIPIRPEPPLPVLLYAMCAEIHDAAPAVYVAYSLGAFADSGLVKLANYLEVNDIQNKAAQHAVWAWANGATKEELVNYGADSVSLENTVQILNANELKSKLNASVSQIVQPSRIDESSEFVSIKKSYMLIFGGTMAFLIVIISFAFFRRDKKAATLVSNSKEF